MKKILIWIITFYQKNISIYLESKNIFFTLINENTIRIAICSLKESDLDYLRENL